MATPGTATPSALRIVPESIAFGGSVSCAATGGVPVLPGFWPRLNRDPLAQ